MKLIDSPAAMHAHVAGLKRQGKRVGFVPTMGFLHEGHLSLVESCRRESCDNVVMSIFVNPLQFGPSEDFERYPRDLKRDQALAEKAGVDVLFVPETSEMYPAGARTHVEVGEMGKVMCGVTRPTHFRGVATVVAKLFHIVDPDVAVFGQKDAQQFFILRRMAQDLNMPVQLVMAPIVREADGLAMSSRNVYLSPEEREQAVCLHAALQKAAQQIDGGERHVPSILQAMREVVTAQSLAVIDYLTVVDTDTLEPQEVLHPPSLIAMAVYFGKTRLIDNIIVHENQRGGSHAVR